jgi:hypothetical protein
MDKIFTNLALRPDLSRLLRQNRKSSPPGDNFTPRGTKLKTLFYLNLSQNPSFQAFGGEAELFKVSPCHRRALVSILRNFFGQNLRIKANLVEFKFLLMTCCDFKIR